VTEIDLAITRTINYAKKFKSKLDSSEIGERLISKKNFSRNEINELVNSWTEETKKNKYYLDKFAKAKEISQKIEEKFGDILFLGITGSVASGHPKKDDDIDFLVITQKNKLWRTRLFLRWWIFKKHIPHRKYGTRGEKDEYCFNLWLDESSLLMPKNKQNLRNSVDLVLVKPLINKKNIYEKFILINNWAKKWVATPYENKISNFKFSISKKNEKEDQISRFINYLYFWPQYWYMMRKIQSEKVGLHEAFFHRQMVK
jgi:predicted nucleotidyltransferase